MTRPLPSPLTRTEHLGWALVKASSTASHYSKVRITRSGKRFTWVRSSSGMEWRETTRGLWTFETEATADAELDTLAQIWRDHLPKRIARAPKSRTEYLEEARKWRTADEAREHAALLCKGAGFSSPLGSATDAQLAQGMFDIEARLNPNIRAERAAKKAARDAEFGAAPFRLTPYGLEKI